jgi:hypothetical protein
MRRKCGGEREEKHNQQDHRSRERSHQSFYHTVRFYGMPIEALVHFVGVIDDARTLPWYQPYFIPYLLPQSIARRFVV